MMYLRRSGWLAMHGRIWVITSARRPSPVRHPATWRCEFPWGSMVVVPDGENGGRGAVRMVAEGPNGYLKRYQIMLLENKQDIFWIEMFWYGRQLYGCGLIAAEFSKASLP